MEENRERNQIMKKRLKQTISMMFILGVVLVFAVLSNTYAGERQNPVDWEVLYTTRNLCYVGQKSVVTIPKEIKKLDRFAFYGNPYVKGLIIPNTVTTIEDYSIYNAPNLQYVIFQGNPKIGKYGIRNCPKLINVSCRYRDSLVRKCAEQNGICFSTSLMAGVPLKKVYLLTGDTFSQKICNSINGPVKWKSSNPTVATIDSKGKIKAKRSGKTIITANVSGTAYSYNVTVYKKSLANRIKQIKKQEGLNALSNYEKIRAVHNWMIKNISYDYKNSLKGTLPVSAGTVEGALLKRKCVCQGYAVGFKKLMDAYKIPCKYVVGKAGGGSHAWNIVKLNGKWYHIDVTWDDPIGWDGSSGNVSIYYTYFLKSSAYMKAHNHSFNTKKYPKCNSRLYDNI